MRMNSKGDRIIDDILVFTSDFISQHLDVISHLVEISKFLPWDLAKYSPRLAARVVLVHESKF